MARGTFSAHTHHRNPTSPRPTVKITTQPRNEADCTSDMSWAYKNKNKKSKKSKGSEKKSARRVGWGCARCMQNAILNGWDGRFRIQRKVILSRYFPLSGYLSSCCAAVLGSAPPVLATPYTANPHPPCRDCSPHATFGNPIGLQSVA